MTIALKTYARLLYNFVYDMRRFLRNSSIRPAPLNEQTKLRALIVMDCHRLEKGMALKEPRLGFGKDVIGRLLSNLPEYTRKYDWDQTAIMTLNVLRSYCDFNSSRGFDVSAIADRLAGLSDGQGEKSAAYRLGGVKEVSKAEILQAVEFDAKKFFANRYSIRNYSEGEVPLGLIEQAVKMAQKTPSVCNRQSSKVYVFSGSKEKLGVLGLQTGNRGFGEQADKVLVVASDLEHFTDVGERNQCWIDGGMFAMSLVYALHSLGVGCCCLNWSVGVGKDRALKRLAGIPDKDSVIMMISVGHLPEQLVVTHSPLKPIEEVLFVK